MVEKLCYKLDFSLSGSKRFYCRIYSPFFDTQFSLVKNGQQNWETTQHPLLNSINPIKEARVSGERVRQMLWSGSLPGGLEKIKNAHSGNKAFPEDSLSSKPGAGGWGAGV